MDNAEMENEQPQPTPPPEVLILPLEELKNLKPTNAQQSLPGPTAIIKKALTDCLKKHGQLKPILLSADRKTVIDGWYTLQACMQLGISPYFIALPESHSCEEIALDLNLACRSLSEGQRAIIGAEIYDNERRFLDGKPSKKGEGRLETRIGNRVAVHGNYVRRAWQLWTKNPDLAAKVKAGNLELTAAEREQREWESLLDRAEQAKLDTGRKQLIELRSGRYQDEFLDIANDSVALILTDPLYSLAALPELRDLGKLAQEKLRPGGALVLMLGDDTFLEMMEEIKKGGPKLKAWRLVAVKFNGPVNTQKGIRSQMRSFVIFFKPGEGFRAPKSHVFPSNLIETHGADTTVHQFGQDPEVFKPFIEWFSSAGDLVLEPFAGGGSVVEACFQCGRKCIAAEKDPEAFAKMQLALLGGKPENHAPTSPSTNPDAETGSPKASKPDARDRRQKQTDCGASVAKNCDATCDSVKKQGNPGKKGLEAPAADQKGQRDPGLRPANAGVMPQQPTSAINPVSNSGPARQMEFSLSDPRKSPAKPDQPSPCGLGEKTSSNGELKHDFQKGNPVVLTINVNIGNPI